jgi:hypothetical protein
LPELLCTTCNHCRTYRRLDWLLLLIIIAIIVVIIITRRRALPVFGTRGIWHGLVLIWRVIIYKGRALGTARAALLEQVKLC